MIYLTLTNIITLVLLAGAVYMWRKDSQSLMNRLSEERGQLTIFHSDNGPKEVRYVDDAREAELAPTEVFPIKVRDATEAEFD
jgi:hypothetical protein